MLRAPVVVLTGDMPFAAPPLLARLAEIDEPLVVPAFGGALEPLQARYAPVLISELDAALARQESLRETVAALSPRILPEEDLGRWGEPARLFFNVNTPADLREAEAQLSAVCPPASGTSAHAFQPLTSLSRVRETTREIANLPSEPPSGSTTNWTSPTSR